MDSPWESAVHRGDVESLRALLDRGADVNARDRHGQTGLMLAAHAGHHGVVETLIARGADVNVTAKFHLNALMLAIVSGHQEIARLLARSGTDLAATGSGAPGFADKTARDLALAGEMTELAAELGPEP